MRVFPVCENGEITFSPLLFEGLHHFDFGHPPRNTSSIYEGVGSTLRFPGRSEFGGPQCEGRGDGAWFGFRILL